MSELPTDAPAAAEDAGGEAARSHVRGSSVLLFGRILALGLNFVSQVLIVRHLTKSGFGAFAYGLSIALVAETAVTLGLDRALGRFVPQYDVRREDGRLFGVIVFVFGTVFALSAVLALAALVLGDSLASSFHDDASARRTILLLLLLGPVQALDNLMIGLFAVLTKPWSIFFRRYVFAPGLRLVVVALLVALDRDATFLALGYVLSGVVGIAIYAVVLGRALASGGFIARFRSSPIELPIRTVVAFTLPLLTTDLVFTVLGSLDAYLVGRSWSPDEVGVLRAVQPVARFNLLVLTSFGLLFTPLASRLRAQQAADDELGRLYWRTALWVAVLSFPMFVASFCLASPLTVALFGSRYDRSGAVLAILAVGYFVNAASGFNSLTLAVRDRLRDIVLINLAAVALAVALNLALVPPHGAKGAAMATAGTLIGYTAMRQLALGRIGIPPFDRAYLRPYGAMLVGALALRGAVEALDLELLAALPLALVLVIAVLALSRRSLDIAGTFPELARSRVGRFLRA
jgi:O-antigen/teichoic acid export membrane protein